MMIPSTDTRSVQQKPPDEKIAMEAPLPPPKLPPDAKARPLEDFSPKAKKPVAIVGIVENV